MEKDKGEVLLQIAREAIGERLGLTTRSNPEGAWLAEERSTFVTLLVDEGLVGCMGSVRPLRSLENDVRENALSAAFEDPRFPVLTATEFPRLVVEVSLLSELESLSVTDEEDLLRRIRPGVDGLILEFGSHRSTYLPQVWEKIPHPQTFVEELKVKAGLRRGFWDPGIRIFRYTVDKWSE